MWLTTSGRSCDSTELASPWPIPAWRANWPITSGPRTFASAPGSTGLFGPPPTHDDITSPSPPRLNALTMSARPPPPPIEGSFGLSIAITDAITCGFLSTRSAIEPSPPACPPLICPLGAPPIVPAVAWLRIASRRPMVPSREGDSGRRPEPVQLFFVTGLLVVDAQHREEGLLRDVHGADPLHPLLAFLLLLEQLALARDVSAVALRDHVLAQR